MQLFEEKELPAEKRASGECPRQEFSCLFDGQPGGQGSGSQLGWTEGDKVRESRIADCGGSCTLFTLSGMGNQKGLEMT